MNFFLSLPEIQFYYFEQKLYQNISNELNHFQISIFFLLFISGIFTSINPCSISIIPLSVSYVIESKLEYVRKNFIILGLFTSMISIIIFTYLLNNYYQQILKRIPIVSSIFMILIGLILLKIIYLKSIYIETHPLSRLSNNTIIKDYITGFIIGLSSSTCSTPIVMTILFWISHSHNILLGIIYLFFYLIGYITPLLLLVNFTINTIQLHLINRIWNNLMPFSGSIMLGLGIFSFLNYIF